MLASVYLTFNPAVRISLVYSTSDEAAVVFFNFGVRGGFSFILTRSRSLCRKLEHTKVTFWQERFSFFTKARRIFEIISGQVVLKAVSVICKYQIQS